MSNATTQWILELVDKVSAPLKTIMGQANGTSDAVEKTQIAIKNLNDRADKLQKKLTKFTVGVAAFAALTYGSVQFENSMARANTMALKAQTEFAGITDQVRELANTIPLARTELSEGLYNVISAGVPENNWIKFLEDSSKTAIAGNAELGTVVNSTSSIIKAYNLDWSKSNDIQDKLMKTVQLGQIPSLEALSTALAKPGPIASQLGVNIDELMSSMTALAGPNGEVNETGTQMKAVMSALLKPSSEAAEMAKNLGVAFDATAVKGAGGLIPFLENLKQKTQAYANQTGVSAQEIYGQLFSSTEAISAIMTLTGSQSELFAQNATEIASSTGVVKQAYEIMSDTIISKSQTARNSFSNMMDNVVVAIAPTVSKLLDLANGVFSMANNFAQAHPVITKWATVIGVGATALYGFGLASMYSYLKLKALTLQMWSYLKPLAVAIIKSGIWVAEMGIGAVVALGSYITALIAGTAAQWNLNVAMNANPIGAFVVGIMALIAVLTGLFFGIKLIIQKWNEWGKYVQLFFQIVFPPLGMFISFIKSIIDNWNYLKAAFKAEGIIGALKGIGKILFDFLVTPIKTMLELISKIPGVGKIADSALAGIDELSAKMFGNTKQLEIKAQLKTFKEEQSERKKNRTTSNPYGVQTDVPADFATSTQNSGNSSSNSSSGSTSKAITMNLDIKNYFNVDSATNIEDLAEKIIGKVNDRLRDAVVQFG